MLNLGPIGVLLISGHDREIKISVISGLVLRAYRLCDQEHLDDEIEFLRNTFRKLGYPEHVFRKGTSRARRSYFIPRQKEDRDAKSFLRLPYHPEFKQFRDRIRAMDKNIEVVFEYGNKLQNLLVRNSAN